MKILHFARNAIPLILLLTGILTFPSIALAVDDDAQPMLQPQREKAVEKSLEVSMEEAVEEAEEKAMEMAAEEETEKEEFKSIRPDGEVGPTKVYFLVFILDIDAIDDAKQSFMANVYLKLRWKDSRLANPHGKTRLLNLDDVWHPQTIIANRQGLVTRSLPEVVHVEPDGTVTYRQRYSGMFSQPMQLSDFPFDRHPFNVHFISVAYNPQQLQFLPDSFLQDPSLIGGSIATDLSLPDWKVVEHEPLVLPYQPIKEIQTAGFAFRFIAERHVEYYFWQLVLPLSVVVMMSWAGFWIQRGQVGVRIGVATSSILTLIAQRFVLTSLLPKLPYMTRMDYFTVGCTLLVLLALIGVVATSYLGTINRDLIARRIDLWARGLFPALFILLLLWFVRG